jgi:hypothetical protein
MYQFVYEFVYNQVIHCYNDTKCYIAAVCFDVTNQVMHRLRMLKLSSLCCYDTL